MSRSVPRQKLFGDEGIRPAFAGMWNPSRWGESIRHPSTAMRQVVGKGSIYTLLVLFGINAVDELDRTGFGILLPTIRDAFGMSNTGITSLVALTLAAALVLQLPIAIMADRHKRVPIVIVGAIAWGVFSFATGMATTIWMLVIARSGAGIGRAVTDPTHNSLLSDYYEIDRRPAVFSFHRAANALGQCAGPLIAGGLAELFDWRVPFFVFSIPTAILVVLAFKLREPIRGIQERRAMGVSEEVAETEEPVPSFAEAWRLVWKVEVLRRIWYAIPFLAVSLVGFVSLAGLLYDEVYGYGDFQRGMLAAIVEPFQLIGLIVGARLGTRLLMRGPALVFRFLRYVAFVAGGFAALFAWSPNIYVSVIANIGVTSTLAILLPGMFSVLAMAIPARARAVGFSVAAYWAIPGLLLVPLIGWLSDNLGIRWGMLSMVPVLVLGAVMISSGASVIDRDINDVWTASATRSRALFLRRQGKAKLLMIKDLNVFYGPVQILFDVNIEVGEGEVVALLGTNGAGKSTLLKAISGVVEADFGAVIFDGRDTTHTPPYEIAALGITQMPGGAGVFPSLSVRENLRVATWLTRRDRPRSEAEIERVLDTFPVLRERYEEPAANLSGGQQQMLALGMALLAEPKLLMIDELSLGLAPVVVEQLAGIVREVAARGTTIIIVEQSVNVALTLAETAYFMEKGQIRFSGPTEELLERPDILRSVFLGGVVGTPVATNGDTPEPAVAVTAEPEPTAPELTEAEADKAEPDGAAPAGTAAALLEVHEASVAFGGILAVDGVSLEVAQGEILGLIGPNGAGKTTLFDLISGFTPMHRGRVVLGGKDLGAMAPDQRSRFGLGRSFQDARLFPSLTVNETLAVAYDRWVEVKDPIHPILRLPASIDSENRVHLRADELIELFGLGAFRDKFVGELSTGSRRVVDLACVVAHSPAVLLLDEPSSGIAQRETEALGPMLVRLRDELGCSILVIEHDMPLIRAVSDRMIALESGTVICEGKPDAVLTDPEVIASYLGNTGEFVARSGARN
ncbi:MAG TPA: MFS transporter [Microthrixaceae bacterium]|nr:MFS transporter [Microthrixaceae bacterium]